MIVLGHYARSTTSRAQRGTTISGTATPLAGDPSPGIADTSREVAVPRQLAEAVHRSAT